MTAHWRKLWQGAAIGMAAFLLAALLAQTELAHRMELASWNWRTRLLAQPGPWTDRIRIVYLDQYSLDWASNENGLPWPWPRQAYVPVVNFMERAGAKALVFDMLFTEDSQFGVEDDQAFADAIAHSGRVVNALMLEQGETGVRLPSGAYLNRQRADEREFSIASPAAERITLPIGVLAGASPRLGNVYETPDDDSIFRRATPIRRYSDALVPNLGLAAYLLANPAATLPDMPRDGPGRVVLAYRGGTAVYPSVNAAAVIQSELRIQSGEEPVIDPGFFRDAYVFFAPSAPGLHDLGPTPLSPTSPRVLVHATFLDNLLTGDFMRPVPVAVQWLFLLLVSLAVAATARLAVRVSTGVGVFAVGLGGVTAAAFAAFLLGFWLELAGPLLATVLAFIGANLFNYATEGRQRRFIKQAFQQYLSPVVIDSLLDSPEKLTLGGEVRELTIFFSDVQGFTGISETLGAERLTRLLNDYLSEMTDIILASGGTIDKFEGDAIIAFWNAPLALADHAERAVRAMLRCQSRLDELRPGYLARYRKEVRARIGVNTGEVVVGNMGSRQRFDYTFLGDAGNLASRLEGVNKVFGTYLLISDMTRRLLPPEIRVREIGRVTVVGRSEPVTVYEPLAAEWAQNHEPLLEDFAEALELLYAGRGDAALALFLRHAATDAPSAHYLSKLRECASEPPAGWDGIWRLTEK